jgi:cyclophilin family peptidyl-prolyl cis-trans isomerase
MRTLTLILVAAALTLAAHAAPRPLPKGGKGNIVLMKTSLGTIKIELLPKKAPATVKNFLRYVDEKFYDGTVFHRVIGKPHAARDFMIQGGGYKKGVSLATTLKEFQAREKKTRPPIKNEADNGLSNLRGTLAMARRSDPDSATAQFFINVADNKFLDHGGEGPARLGYCVFGKVIGGMDVLDKIKAVKTRTVASVFSDVPVKEVVIESIRRTGR